MNNNVCLFFMIFVLTARSFAMEMAVPQQAQQNPFDLITHDSVIVQIADQLDVQSCGRLRQTCKRFNNVAWPSESSLNVKIKRKGDQSEEDYWQGVFDRIGCIEAMIKRYQRHNPIILYPHNGLAYSAYQDNPLIKRLSFPVGLSKINITGLGINSYDVELPMLEKLPEILPNLKMLGLTGHYRETLPSTLKRLMTLQSLYVFRYKVSSEHLAFVPPSVTTLSLIECDISDIPQTIAQLSSLRSLNLSQNENLVVEELEKLVRLAPHLEKLCISNIELEKLPRCLGSFEKLQELDISQNYLKPDALACLTGLINLRWINLAGNSKCESQKDLVRCMFPEKVTIAFKDTYRYIASIDQYYKY